MSQSDQLTPYEFSRILDEKLEEKLKPITRLIDDLTESVSFLSEKFELVLQRINDVKAKLQTVEEQNKCLKSEILRLSKSIENFRHRLFNHLNLPR